MMDFWCCSKQPQPWSATRPQKQWSAPPAYLFQLYHLLHAHCIGHFLVPYPTGTSSEEPSAWMLLTPSSNFDPLPDQVTHTHTHAQPVRILFGIALDLSINLYLCLWSWWVYDFYISNVLSLFTVLVFFWYFIKCIRECSLFYYSLEEFR